MNDARLWWYRMTPRLFSSISPAVRRWPVLLFGAAVLLRWPNLAAAATSSPLVLAPDFELPADDGKPFKLSEHSGVVRALFFIRNNGQYVGDALATTEKVVSVAPALQQKTLLVCIVGEGLEGSQLESFRQQFHLKWTFLHDRAESVHRLYQIIAVPTVIIVDERGNICGRVAGYGFAFGVEFRALLRQALGLPPLSAEAVMTTATRQALHYQGLGDRMVQRNMWAAALQNYQKALEIAPEMTAARWGAGFCMLRLGKAEAGAQEFQKVLATDPASTRALVGLAWAKTLEGKADVAQGELEKLRALTPNLPEYFEAWAAVHEATGALEAAKQDRDKAESLRGRPVVAPVSLPKRGKSGR